MAELHPSADSQLCKLTRALHAALSQRKVCLAKVQTLLESGASLLHRKEQETDTNSEKLEVYGQNALQIAVIHHSRVDLVNLLMDSCESDRLAELIDNTDSDFWDAIHTSVSHGHEKAALCIFERRLTIEPSLNVAEYLLPWKQESVNRPFGSPLFTAAWHGFAKLIQAFIDNIDGICRQEALNHGLYEAARARKFKCGKLFLQMGADVNFDPQNDNQSVLSIAVQGNNLKMVKLLVEEYGAYVNVGTDNWSNPLRKAILLHNVSMVELLVTLGAEVNESSLYDTNCSVPFLLAISEDAVGVCQMLLSKGGDPSVPSGGGETALHLAAYNRNSRCLQYLLSPAFTYRYNINLCKGKHGSPLAVAVSKGNHRNALFLLKHGADPNLLDNSGRTMIISALMTFGHIKSKYSLTTLIHLLQFGADLNSKGNISKDHDLLPLNVALDVKKSPVLFKVLWEAGSSEFNSTISAVCHAETSNKSHIGFVNQPRTLRNVCRITIRHSISCFTSIDELPVPTALKHYLNFGDLHAYINELDEHQWPHGTESAPQGSDDCVLQ